MKSNLHAELSSRRQARQAHRIERTALIVLILTLAIGFTLAIYYHVPIVG